MSSFEDISKMFDTEYDKLVNLITTASSESDLTLHEIVETYYQIMNVSSMITMLAQQLDSDTHKSLLEKITQTENLISEKFNKVIHPQIKQQLESSIQETTSSLQSASSEQKTKDEIENEAKAYETLRQKMSTKEFVEQYEQGL